MPLLCFLRHRLINQGFQSTPSFRKQNQKPSNFTWHLKHEETSHVSGGQPAEGHEGISPTYSVTTSVCGESSQNQK